VTSANGSKRRPSISNTVIYSCTKDCKLRNTFEAPWNSTPPPNNLLHDVAPVTCQTATSANPPYAPPSSAPSVQPVSNSHSAHRSGQPRRKASCAASNPSSGSRESSTELSDTLHRASAASLDLFQERCSLRICLWVLRNLMRLLLGILGGC
jgi:hypothetical protein